MGHQSWKSVAALALVAAAYVAAYAHAQGQADAKAAAVMTEVRKALGGEQKIAGMKGLSLRADYRRELSVPGGSGSMTFVMMGGSGTTGGSQQATGKIEIDVDLPDKYLRSDIGSAGLAMTRTDGFEASRPFLEVVPNAPGMHIQVDNPATDPARAKAALRRSQTDLARLFLGLTGGTQPGFPVTYAYGGQAESPDGKADIIDVTGPDDFKVRLFVDAETHLPLMLSYMEPEPRMVTRMMTPGNRERAGGRGGPAPAGTAPRPELTQEQRDEIAKQMKEAEATPPKLVEYRMFFSDYRTVDGVSLPHRIARGLGAKTTEEWDVTSYRVNPSFKADRFKVGS
jgi:hypothetical protein